MVPNERITFILGTFLYGQAGSVFIRSRTVGKNQAGQGRTIMLLKVPMTRKSAHYFRDCIAKSKYIRNITSLLEFLYNSRSVPCRDFNSVRYANSTTSDYTA